MSDDNVVPLPGVHRITDAHLARAMRWAASVSPKADVARVTEKEGQYLDIDHGGDVFSVLADGPGWWSAVAGDGAQIVRARTLEAALSAIAEPRVAA